MHGILRDLSYSTRQLLKNRVTTVVAIVSLALGIGATATIFSAINALILRSLPVRNPEQLVRIRLTDPKNQPSDLSIAMFQQLRAQQSVFSEMFAWRGGGISNIRAGGAMYAASTSTVSGEYFSTLGITPRLGRFIDPGDLALDSGLPAAVAVIGHGCWKQRYGGDPDVAGKTILVEERPLTIIGVAPEGFRGLMIDGGDEVTIPVGFSGRTTYRDKRELGFEVYGRLKTGASIEQARAWLESIWPSVLSEAMPGDLAGPARDTFAARRVAVSPAATGSSFLREQYRRPLLVLMGIAAALLLVACVNIASLMLARNTDRSQEFAVRMALGASGWRLTRQIAIESLLLSAAGAIPGLALAHFAAPFLLSSMWSGLVPLALEAGVDSNVLAFTAITTAVAGIAFSLLPARRFAALRENSRSVHRGWKAGRLLVPLQVALSLVSVLNALVFVRSLSDLLSRDSGFRDEGILVVQMFPQKGSESQRMPDRSSYYRELAERLRAIPSVEAVSYSHMGPLLRYELKSPASVKGSRQASAPAVFEVVGPGFFDLAGMRMQAGRDFAWTDTDRVPRVCVISENLARSLFPAGGAVGSRVDFREHKALEVVGVVSNASLWMPQSREPMAVFLAFLQEPTYNSSHLDIRYRGSSGEVAREAGRVLESMGRQYALRTQTIEERMDGLLAPQRIVAMLSSFAGGLTVLLAAIGLYGMLARAVARRRAEIGVRMAVGASPRDASRMIVKEAMWMVLAGAFAGVPAAIAVSRIVAGAVLGMSPLDWKTIAISLAIMGCASLLSAYAPARGAARVSPAEALRT